MKSFINTPQQQDTANFFLQMLVALALVAALFVAIWQVALGNLKADSAVVGSIFTMFIILVNFCFPSSIGSQKSQDTINTLATAASAPMTTTTTVEQGAPSKEATNVDDQSGTLGVTEPSPGSGIQRGAGSDSSGQGTAGAASSTSTTSVPSDDDVDYAPTEAPR